MGFQEWANDIVEFVRNNQAWAAPVVFILAFTESLAFLSLIVPATFILVGVAGLISLSGIDFWPLLLAGWAGSSLGYSVSYWIGLFFKDSIHRIWPFTTHPYLLPRGRQFFERYGVLGVFLGHFFGPVRAVVPVVAGMFAMSQLKFQAANLSSSLIWAVAALSPAILGIELMLKTVAALAALVLVALFGAWLVQRRFIYFPSIERVTPATAGLAHVREVTLETPDGNRLVCWYGPATDPAKPTILYFHGNAGNLAARSGRVEMYTGQGYGFFMMAYRGYSGSTGSPSETANVADAGLAYEHLLALGLRPEEIVVYGESLGTGVAARLASERPVVGLILDSPFTSMIKVASHHYPYVPVGLILSDRYQTIQYIGEVKAPLLVLHGEQDDIIPVEMGRRVFEAANEPKTLEVFPEGGHIDHWQLGSYDKIFDWLRKLPGGSRS
ncbi:MAG: hypothetical protein RLZ98_1583 [Pseudomonadota bacterium]|jgi:membrane protein DedA with SNARE-associated domain/pimeloyl-ACP methyl ester carboxylesterase